jgi:hypothetical protein
MPTVESVAERIRYEGEWVTFVRNTDAEPITATVKAFVRGYAPNELVGDIDQGDRVLRVAPGDLVNAGWPDAPREPDQVEIGSARAVVQDVETRTLRGVDCIHIIHVRGG